MDADSVAEEGLRRGGLSGVPFQDLADELNLEGNLAMDPIDLLPEELKDALNEPAEQVTNDISNLGTSALLGTAAKIATASNPWALAASMGPYAHEAGAKNPAVQGLKLAEARDEGKYNIKLNEMGVEIPTGNFVRGFNRNALQTAAGFGNMLESAVTSPELGSVDVRDGTGIRNVSIPNPINAIMPANIAERAANQRHNPHNLPINPETGYPMGSNVGFGPATEIRKPRPSPDTYLEFPGITIPGSGRIKDWAGSLFR